MQPQWIETDHHKAIYKTYDYVPGVIASGRFAFVSGQDRLGLKRMAA